MHATPDLNREPELEILLTCARLHLTPDQQAAIREQLARGINQNRLLALIQHHRLIPLTHRHLSSIAADKMAPTLMAGLSQAYQSHVLRSLTQLVTLRKVLSALQGASIPVIPLKGAMVAQQLYGSHHLRQSRDIDILVPRQHVQSALKVLRELGYRVAPPFDQIIWHSPIGHNLLNNNCELELLGPNIGDPIVELHWSLRPQLDVKDINTETLWRDAVPTQFCELPIYQLSPQWLLMFLCYHGSRHLFGRLHWLCDIGIASNTCPEWEAAEALAQRGRIESTLGAAVLSAQRLLGSPFPPVSSSTLERGKPLHALIVKNLCSRSPVVNMPSVQRFCVVYNAHNRGWRGFSVALQQVVHPNPQDFSLLGRSNRLVWLAYGVRPFRLAGKYLRAALSSWDSKPREAH